MTCDPPPFPACPARLLAGRTDGRGHHRPADPGRHDAPCSSTTPAPRPRSKRPTARSRTAASRSRLLAADLRNAGFYARVRPDRAGHAGRAARPVRADRSPPCSAGAAAAGAGHRRRRRRRRSTACRTCVPAPTCWWCAAPPPASPAPAGCAPVSDGGPFFQASLCDNATELDSGDSADFLRARHRHAGAQPPQAQLHRSGRHGTLAACGAT